MGDNEDSLDRRVSIEIGDIEHVSGELNIAGRDILKGYTAEQVSNLLEQITTSFTPKPFSGQSPYKGLAAFEQEDAALFFGRDRLVAELIQKIGNNRTVFIIGPSGFGKSSLVRAGLIPALKRGAISELHSEQWLYETMVPGREPFNELARVASSLAGNLQAGEDVREAGRRDATVLAQWCEVALKDRRDKRAVIFIDQFEEVFTQVKSEAERVAFLDLLTHAATAENGRTMILFCLRSDFVMNCAAYPPLNALLNQRLLQVGAMQPEELVNAIAQPAVRVGLRIDPELIAQIINDMQGEPGALPLMQFALKDLFDAKAVKGGVMALTLEDYLQRGGIHQSLERHADRVFEDLNPRERELAGAIFSGLVEIGRDTQDTRRVALFEELVPADYENMAVSAVIQKLADARLITTDKKDEKETVTLAHEKLIKAWPWLDKLVNDNREVIALQNEIASDAKTWDDNQRNPSYLYSGARLINIGEHLSQKSLVLTGLAREFVRTGQARQRRVRAISWAGVSAFILLLIFAVIIFRNQADANARLAQQNEDIASSAQAASTLAVANAATAQAFSTQSAQNASTAEARRIEAEFQTGLATSRQLAAQSQSVLKDRQDLALLLSLQGYLTSHTNEALSAMLAAFNYNEMPYRLIYGKPHERPQAMAISTQSGMAAVGYEDGAVVVIDLDSGKVLQTVNIDDGLVWALFFLPDGRLLIGVTGGRIYEWKQGEEIPQRSVEAYQPIVALRYNQTEEKGFSIDRYGNLLTWNIADENSSLVANLASFITQAEFSLDGKYLVFERDGAIVVYSMMESAEIFEQAAGVVEVAINPDGSQIAAIGSGNQVLAWDVQTGKQTTLSSNVEIQMEIGSADLETQPLIYSPDGRFLALTGGSTVRVWDARTARLLSPILHAGTAESIGAIAFSHDSQMLLAALSDGNVIQWDLPVSPDGLIMATATGSSSATLSPDGSLAAFSYEGLGQVRLWDTTTGRPANGHLGGAQDRVIDAAISPQGETLALISHPDGLRLWDLVTAKPVGPLLTGLSSGHLVFDSLGSAIVLNYDSDNVEARNAYTDGRVSIPSLPAIFESIRPISELNPRITVASSISQTLAVDILTGDVLGSIDEGLDSFYAAAFVATESGGRLAGIAQDTLVVWDIPSGSRILEQSWDELNQRFSISFHGSMVETMRFSHDGKYLVTQSRVSGFEWIIIVWNLENGDAEKTRLVEEFDSYGFNLSPKDDSLIMFGRDGSLQIFSFPDLSLLLDQSNIPNVWFQILRFSNDGEQFVTVDDAGNAGLWDTQTGTRLPQLWGVHLAQIVDLSFDKSGRRLASAGTDNTVAIWSTSSGELEIGPHQLSFPIEITAFDETGNRLAIGGSDGSFAVWHLDTDEVVENHELLDSSITAIMLHPTEPWLAIASSDEMIRILDTSDWTQRAVLAINGLATELSWTGDSASLLIAGDHMLVHFDPRDGELKFDISSIQNELDSVKIAALSPDTQMPLVFNRGRLMIWSVEENNPYGPAISLENDALLDAKMLPDGHILAIIQNLKSRATSVVTLTFVDWYTAICHAANRGFTLSEQESYQLDALPEKGKLACEE